MALQFIIRAIGKANESWQRDAIDLYLQRLKPFARVEVIELPEGHGGSAKPDTTKTQDIEAHTILKGIPTDARLIVLSEEGRSLSSPIFAQTLQRFTDDHRPIVFVIGGSWGIADEIKQRANLVLSFGAMTLPHMLARLILVEQLYRAMMINSGREYHK